jgi:hypothetical protein
MAGLVHTTQTLRALSNDSVSQIWVILYIPGGYFLAFGLVCAYRERLRPTVGHLRQKKLIFENGRPRPVLVKANTNVKDYTSRQFDAEIRRTLFGFLKLNIESCILK